MNKKQIREFPAIQERLQAVERAITRSLSELGRVSLLVFGIVLVGGTLLANCAETVDELTPVVVCPDSTLLVASLESCRTQRARVVEQNDELIGEVADLRVRVRELEDERGDPISCVDYTMPPETWCTWRIR